MDPKQIRKLVGKLAAERGRAHERNVLEACLWSRRLRRPRGTRRVGASPLPTSCETLCVGGAMSLHAFQPVV